MEVSICPSCSGEKELKGKPGKYFCAMCSKVFDIKIHDLDFNSMLKEAEFYTKQGIYLTAREYYREMMYKYPDNYFGYIGHIKTYQNHRARRNQINCNWYKERPEYETLNTLNKDVLNQFKLKEVKMMDSLKQGKNKLKEQYKILFYENDGVNAIKYLLMIENVFMDKTVLLKQIMDLKHDMNESLTLNEEQAFNEIVSEQASLMEYVIYLFNYFCGVKTKEKTYDFEKLTNSKVFNYFKMNEKKAIVQATLNFLDCKNAYVNNEKFIHLNECSDQLRKYSKSDIHNKDNINYVDVDTIDQFVNQNIELDIKTKQLT